MEQELMKDFAIDSPAFRDGGEIPRKYTCEGKNISPPLNWNKPPRGTKSFVLIVDDPDAPDPKHPQTTWVHWLLYNLPAHLTSLEEGITDLAEGSRMGVNDWLEIKYGGPCPPIGRHRYFHKIYALDKEFLSLEKPNKEELEEAMKGCILATSQIVGTYQKQSHSK